MNEGQRFINKSNPKMELTILDLSTKYAFVSITNYAVSDYFGGS